MKLSEAILLGASKRPQAFGIVVNMVGETCALGAALDGSHRNVCQNMTYSKWVEFFPIFKSFSLGCPLDGCTHRAVNEVMIIPHLNDFHKMSREAIALWVETIEKKLEDETKQKETQSPEVTYTEVANGQCVESR